jgi:hypothetical protein
VTVTRGQCQVPTFFIRRYRICLRSASTPSVSVSGTLSCVPTALFSVPRGSRAIRTRGERRPPWLLLFRMPLQPCLSSRVCNRVPPPERIVSVRRDMEGESTPCVATTEDCSTEGPRSARRLGRTRECRPKGSDMGRRTVQAPEERACGSSGSSSSSSSSK